MVFDVFVIINILEKPFISMRPHFLVINLILVNDFGLPFKLLYQGSCDAPLLDWDS